MDFVSLGISPLLARRLDELGYDTPTPIQVAAIPAVLAGRDVMAGAQTGTGKTAAFALPLLHKLTDQAGHNGTLSKSETQVSQIETANSTRRISVLVLVPTRELAQQVHRSFVTYSEGLALRSIAVYGGASINPQLAELKKGCDVLVATPGRLMELILNNWVTLNDLKTLVLDEADRMLDMGFIVDIKQIQKSLPSNKQTLFFSATFNADIFEISKTLLKNPRLIEVDPRNATANSIETLVYQVDKHRKSALLSYLIGVKNWQQVLIFTRTKQGADDLAAEMQKDGISIQSIHGDKSQGARDRILAGFKDGKIRALVATDVAARGLDIKQLQYVINHELPYNAEDYIHRVGRTGRAGASGLAISLVSAKETYLLTDIEKLLGVQFVTQWLEGFEPSLNKELDAAPKRGNSKKQLRAKALGTKALGAKAKKGKKPNWRR